MKLGLRNREAIRAISPILEDELDNMMATIGQTMTREHDTEGRHTNITAESIETRVVDGQMQTPAATTVNIPIPQTSGQHWKSGPWIFDELNGASPEGAVRTVLTTGGTANNWDGVVGVDNSVVIEVNSSGTFTLTGLLQTKNYRRLLVISCSPSSSGTIVLKHESSSSIAKNRFSLPGSVDITMSAGQIAWLMYNPLTLRWQLSVTNHTSGGLAGGGTSTAQYATLSLTDAQIRSLNTTPLTIVAAQGSGSLIGVASWAISTQVTGAFSAAPIYSLRFNGLAADTFGTWSSAMNSVARRWFFVTINPAANTSTPPVNADLQIRGSADVTGGTSAYFRVHVLWYAIPTFGS